MGDVEKEVVGVKRGRSCGLDRGRGDVRERGEEVVGSGEGNRWCPGLGVVGNGRME